MLNQDALAAEMWDEKSPSLASRILAGIMDACLYASVALVPLFFLPITLDVLELNKQSLLMILCLVGMTAWLGKALAERRFVVSRSWMHLIVILFAGGWLLTSLFSKDLYLSLVGNFGQMQWSFASVIAFVIFYFLLANRVGTSAKLFRFLLVFLASSAVVGLFGLLQMTGVFAFGGLFDFTKSTAFNTVGTVNALGVFMVIPLVIATSLTIFGCRDYACKLGEKAKPQVLSHVIVWTTLAIAFFIAVAIDFWVIWAGILFGTLLLVVLPVFRSLGIKHPARIAAPTVLVSVSILFLIFKTPISLNIPAEVSPSLTASMDIATSVLRESPLFGSGPGTWIYDYAKFRSPSVNLSQFWTVRFERGISSAASLPAMIGIVGMALWLMLLISAIVKSAMHLIKEKDDDMWQAYISVFVAWATCAFIAFLYNYNFAHHFSFWFLLALLAAMVTRRAYTWDSQKNQASSIIISVSFIMLCVTALTATWLVGQRLAADAAYSNAVVSYRNGKPVDEAINALNSAVAMNRLNDAYYRNLSQAYLLKAAQMIEEKKTDTESVNAINTVIAAAVDTAKRAADVNPANVDNWENLAVVYQSITSFTQGADEFAVKAFEKALEYEPSNPAYAAEIGKLYLMRSDAYRTLMESKDTEVVKKAEESMKKELDSAAEWFNKSIQSKPDFAPAHYHLGLVYERQNKLPDAILKLEQALSVDDKNVGIAFQLAILYYRNNEKAKSLNMFEQIVSFSPKYANARWYLSALYEEEKRYEDALKQVKEVEVDNKDNELVTKRIEYLEGLMKKGKTPAEEAKPVQLPQPVTEKIQGPEEGNLIKP